MIFNINRKTNFSIRLFGKSVYTFYDHTIVKFFSTQKSAEISIPQNVEICEIASSNLDVCKGGAPLDLLEGYLKKQEKVVKGYAFIDKETKDPIGFYWLFLPGCNEAEYKVRSAPMVSNVFVFENHRGHGYASLLIKHSVSVCEELGYSYILGAVRKNNRSAWNAYNKIGYEVIGNKRFIRILKLNIPYHSL